MTRNLTFRSFADLDEFLKGRAATLSENGPQAKPRKRGSTNPENRYPGSGSENMPLSGPEKPVKRRSKYGNRQTEYAGVVYDSKREADYARTLDVRLRAGEILTWARQLPLVLHPSRVVLKLDFLVVERDGRLRWIDAKGFRTREWQTKRRLAEAIYGIEIKEV